MVTNFKAQDKLYFSKRKAVLFFAVKKYVNKIWGKAKGRKNSLKNRTGNGKNFRYFPCYLPEMYLEGKFEEQDMA